MVPDTARTLAAIKTLLADNTSGDISPQDMRDVVESIVNPVPDGGFHLQATDEMLYAYSPSLGVTADATDAYLGGFEVGDYASDPGWSLSDSYASTWDGGTVAAYSSWLLPRGVYAIRGMATLASDPGAGKSGHLYFDFTLDPSAIDPVRGDPGFALPTNIAMTPGGYGTESRRLRTDEVFVVSETMAAAAIPIGLVIAQDSGTPMAVSAAEIFIVRL